MTRVAPLVLGVLFEVLILACKSSRVHVCIDPHKRRKYRAN